MDTSPKYILMSEKAELSQERLKDGDYYFIDDHLSIWLDYIHGRLLSKREQERYRRDAIRLLRQDQLQEMISNCETREQLFELRDRFSEFGISTLGITDYAIQFYSMEQLWLAFVMREKYGKVWNGNDWVRES